MPLAGMSVWAAVWILLIGTVLFFLDSTSGNGLFQPVLRHPLCCYPALPNMQQLGQIGQVKLSSAVVMRARLLNNFYAVVRWRGIALTNSTASRGRKRIACTFAKCREVTSYVLAHTINQGNKFITKSCWNHWQRPLCSPHSFTGANHQRKLAWNRERH